MVVVFAMHCLVDELYKSFPGEESRLIGKDPDAGKDSGQEEKRATENEMVGWPHRLNGHKSE